MDLERLSPRPRRVGGPAWWVAVVTAVVGVLAFCSLAAVTHSSWASGAVTNSGNSAATGSLAFTHTYAAGPTCAGGPGASSVACTGTLASGQVTGSGLSAADAITNNGNVPSARLTQTVALTSCEPVAFANTKTPANPLVDRYATSFNQAGPPPGASATFDGNSGYATGVAALPQQPTSLIAAGTFSGIGIWFKANATSGPLFSFGASASNGSGNVDRTLYLNASGQLSFVWNTAGSSIGPTTTSGGYADNVWHFAYVTLGGINVVVIGLIPQVTLYVDGVQRAATPLISLSPLSSYSGYWHAGYAPTATTGLTTSYFGGSLSNFVVFNGTVPTAPPAYMGTSLTFAAFAANATEWWPLNDTGTTTFTGTLPVVGAGFGTTASAACKTLDLGWSFTNPAGSATSAASSLYAWVATPGTTTTAVGAPGPGATQSATLALTHDASYDAYVAGLHLWVPMTSTISLTPGAKWALVFAWTPSATTTIIPTA